MKVEFNADTGMLSMNATNDEDRGQLQELCNGNFHCAVGYHNGLLQFVLTRAVPCRQKSPAPPLKTESISIKIRKHRNINAATIELITVNDDDHAFIKSMSLAGYGVQGSTERCLLVELAYHYGRTA